MIAEWEMTACLRHIVGDAEPGSLVPEKTGQERGPVDTYGFACPELRNRRLNSCRSSGKAE